MAKYQEFLAEGGCGCGNLRYLLTSKPMVVHCCHCTWCQRETGSAFAVNALIETSRVLLLKGRPQIIGIPSASGKGQKICRCPLCKVAVWSHHYTTQEAISYIRVGTLDKPSRLPPDVHIYTASKQPWMILPLQTPSVPEYYDSELIWSKESLKRRRVLEHTR